MTEPRFIHPEAAAVMADLIDRRLITVNEAREFLNYPPFDDEITDDVKAASREIFEGKVEGKTACWHCGGLHGFIPRLEVWRQPCPRIKHVVYDGGHVREVEYWSPGTWETGIIFPDNVYDE